MPKARVWAGRPLHPQAQAILEPVAEVIVSTAGEFGDWYGEAATAEAILVRGSTVLSGEVMDRIGPRLRIIGRPGIGVDAVDLAAATERGILVLNTPDGPTESTAEHAIALLLALCKQVMAGDRLLRAGRPFPTPEELRPGMETAGTVLGLVGIGRIGGRVAVIANALGMKVLAYDPFATAERASSLGVELLPSLEELLPRVNVLSLHCPSTPETYHLINANTLNLMPRAGHDTIGRPQASGPYLINVARGALVDEVALLDALRSGRLAGAGLDVFDPEPPATDNPLLTLPNTICTPHIGSYTTAGLLRSQLMVCEQIASALRDERPPYLVNADVWEHRRR